jgi:3-methyladenine DNA glycosylase AlkD
MLELEALGKENIKKRYLGRGAREPLFGVGTGAMKPLFRRIKKDQALAEALYASGNYDAMYFAGMIADPQAMTGADFDRWMEAAYFPMLSDFVVAVTLAEADCAQDVADRWIPDGRELYRSAGWACYEWLLGWRPDADFDREKIMAMLETAGRGVDGETDQVRSAMNNFVTAVGVSYLPLRGEAYALTVGTPALSTAAEALCRAEEKGQLGFKRRAVRC